jgi:hypothetical protein
MRRENYENTHSPEQKKRGNNVEIILKFMRHGERTPEGLLTDYGREVTKERARGSGIQGADFDAVKAIGSDAGAKGPSGLGRSLETAQIVALEIAGDEAFKTRASDILNPLTMVHQVPFDWDKMYKSNLPENFSELSDQEKAMAAKKAQTAIVNYLVQLNTPEAEAYKREAAGAFAHIIEHYRKMAKKLDADSKVLMPAGTHGGVMEFILQQAGVRKDEEGKEIKGFTDLKEIGGEFNPSDAFNVDVATDEAGENKPLVVSFDNKNRPQAPMYLDENLVRELAQEYESLHASKDPDKEPLAHV